MSNTVNFALPDSMRRPYLPKTKAQRWLMNRAKPFMTRNGEPFGMVKSQARVFSTVTGGIGILKAIWNMFRHNDLEKPWWSWAQVGVFGALAIAGETIQHKGNQVYSRFKEMPKDLLDALRRSIFEGRAFYSGEEVPNDKANEHTRDTLFERISETEKTLFRQGLEQINEDGTVTHIHSQERKLESGIRDLLKGLLSIHPDWKPDDFKRSIKKFIPSEKIRSEIGDDLNSCFQHWILNVAPNYLGIIPRDADIESYDMVINPRYMLYDTKEDVGYTISFKLNLNEDLSFDTGYLDLFFKEREMTIYSYKQDPNNPPTVSDLKDKAIGTITCSIDEFLNFEVKSLYQREGINLQEYSEIAKEESRRSLNESVESLLKSYSIGIYTED